MRKARTGFTLIEVLTAIAIIMILAGMLFVGAGVISRTTKTSATRTVLENARAMLGDLDATTKLSRYPVRWWWSGSDATYVGAAGDHLFWGVPHRNGNAAGGYVEALFSVGSIAADTPLNRYSSDAVRNTGLAFDIIQSLPAAKAALQKIPPDQMHVAVSTWSGTTPYTVGQRVRYVSGTSTTWFYECIQNHTNQTPTSTTYWRETDSSLLDGWGNPIVFVPSSGLDGVTIGGQNNMVVRSTGVVTHAAAVTAANLGGRPPTASDRPFFVSAGPDGILSTGDDNVYSFEN